MDISHSVGVKEFGDSGKQSEKAWKILWVCTLTCCTCGYPRDGHTMALSWAAAVFHIYSGDFMEGWIEWSSGFFPNCGPRPFMHLFLSLKENCRNLGCFHGLFAHHVDSLAFIKHQAWWWMFPLVNFPSQRQSMFLKLKINFYMAQYNQDFISVLLNYWKVLHAGTRGPLHTT